MAASRNPGGRLAPAAPAPGSPVSSAPSSPVAQGQASPESKSPLTSPSSTPTSPPPMTSPACQAAGGVPQRSTASPRPTQAQRATAAVSLTGITQAGAPLKPGHEAPSHKVRVRTYATSPFNLRLANCGCQTSRHEQAEGDHPLSTANDTVRLMLERLDKVLRRLCGMTPHREVRDAATRVCHELRARGYELFHLAGWEEPPHIANQGRDVAATTPARREISVVFMVPAPIEDEPTGHRPLAQIVVHLVDTPRRARQLENVAVRYDDDWEDWTVCQDFEFFREAGRPKPERRRLGEDNLGSAVQVCEAMWDEVVQVVGQGGSAKSEFRNRLVRVVARLVEDELLMSAYEVEMGYRLKPGSSRRCPVVKVSILALPKALFGADGADQGGRAGVGESLAAAVGGLGKENGVDSANNDLDGAQSSGEGAAVSGEKIVDIGTSKAEQDDWEIGTSANATNDAETESKAQRVTMTCPAVILVDVSRSSGQYKVKHIAVVYDGEWPISHLYRKNIPAPDLAGLVDCVRE